MIKTHFNDSRNNKVKWVTKCPSCRCDTEILVTHYPHGPNEVAYCPVCGDTYCTVEKLDETV